MAAEDTHHSDAQTPDHPVLTDRENCILGTTRDIAAGRREKG
jgi:hypothetical protein